MILGVKTMSKPQFKVFSCIFCTIGYNTYVAGHKLVCGTYDRLSNSADPTCDPSQVKSQAANRIADKSPADV
jgi:hypothetical protein